MTLNETQIKWLTNMTDKERLDVASLAVRERVISWHGQVKKIDYKTAQEIWRFARQLQDGQETATQWLLKQGCKEVKERS